MAISFLQRTLYLIKGLRVILCQLSLRMQIDVRLLKPSNGLRHLLLYGMKALGTSLDLALRVGEMALKLRDSRGVSFRRRGAHRAGVVELGFELLEGLVVF